MMRAVKILLITLVAFAATVVSGMFTEVSADAAKITLNSISDKHPGETVEISGTSIFPDVVMKVLNSNQEPIYFNATVPLAGAYSEEFKLPANSPTGLYKVIVGRGEEVAERTFLVESSGTIPPIEEPVVSKPSIPSGVSNGSETTSQKGVLPSNAYGVTVFTRDDGRQMERLVVNANKLADAFAKLIDNDDDILSLIIPISTLLDGSEIHLPVDILLETIASDPEATLLIQSSDMEYKVPLKAVQQALETYTSGVLIITLEKPSAAMTSELRRSLAAQGLDIVGDIFSFNISLQSGSTIVEIDDFGDVYLPRTFTFISDGEEGSLTAVWYDSVTQSFMFVPAIISEINGITTVTALTPHNSYYTIVRTNQRSFSDVPSSHWAKNEIEKLAAKLLLAGKSEQIYAPSSEVKRSEFTTMLVKALGLKPLPPTDQFKDTKDEAWYARYISSGTRAGLVYGVTQETFKPDDPITRAQMAVMIDRAMNWVSSAPVQSKGNSYSSIYEDWSQLPLWASPAIVRIIDAGIMKGITASQFNGNRAVTRAEAAVVLERMMVHIGFLNE
jgi:hypothetical protein